MGMIQLQCKVFPGAFLLYLCKPRVAVDNAYEQIVRWGENPLQVPPGRHHLRVWFNYITGPTNVADLVVDVAEGQAVRVVYKTRWMIFLPGKLEVEGLPPQAGAPYAGGPAGAMPMAQQVPRQAPVAAGQAPAGWNPDPMGRHQHRWWDGQQWTSAVADGGVSSEDPV